MFHRKIIDRLGKVGAGVTAPEFVRADDGLMYVAKDEVSGATETVRASEYLWLSVAKAIALPAPSPEILEAEDGRLLLATRRETSLVTGGAAAILQELLSGRLLRGGAHLSRIYAFDLFAGNWDRHPGNYLVIQDGPGSSAVFSIDYSHVPAHPGLLSMDRDPVSNPRTATREYFSLVVAPYGPDSGAAKEIANRLSLLNPKVIEAAVEAMPSEWLDQPTRNGVVNWWSSAERDARAAAVSKGLQDGTLI